MVVKQLTVQLTKWHKLKQKTKWHGNQKNTIYTLNIWTPEFLIILILNWKNNNILLRSYLPLLHSEWCFGHSYYLPSRLVALVLTKNVKIIFGLDIFFPACYLLVVKGSHRLEKYLNIQDSLEKSLKIKFALKGTLKHSKALNLTI